MGNKVKKSIDVGFIKVELPGCVGPYLPGQVVHGVVNLHLREPCFPAVNLTVGLYGSEDVYFETAHSKENEPDEIRPHYGF